MLNRKTLTLAISAILAGAAIPAVSVAQSAGAGARATNGNEIEEVIVTAQKREQSVNDVGLTITEATGDTLAERGISSPSDLQKLVPGFSYTESIYSTPVFTLRGIGLYDATFGAPPAVSVYTDEVPRNLPVMSSALDLDIERVEVLKGPQGTLFGQSSTGGAINYITAKPTAEFEAGAKASIERFGRFDGSVYLSGPVSDTVGARLALRAVEGGAWQQSISRGDKLGDSRKFMGRLTVDFNPAPGVKIEATGTYVKDHSDPQAPQYVKTVFNTYSAAALAAANASPATANPYGVVDNAAYAALTNPTSSGYDATFLGRQATLVSRLHGANAASAAGARAILGTPQAQSARDAEWTPGLLDSSQNSYYQGTVRADIDINDDVTLTSISAYAHQNLDYSQDLDGTAQEVVDVPLFGSVRAFNQELRLSGKTDATYWIVGANYDDLSTDQNNFYRLSQYSANDPLGGVPIQLTLNQFTSKLKTTAAFGNLEFKVSDQFTLNGGVRYTKNKQSATYCYNDPAIDTAQHTAAVFSIFEWLFTGAAAPRGIGAGQCFPLGDGLAGTTFGVATRSPVARSQDENNFSFRVGANYKMEQGTLLYGTISQGYKTGIFSAIGASSTSQYSPAVQEKVIAYEAGFKAPLADRSVNLNGSVFYYDYRDKQVRGRVLDAIYGLLEKMVNVPKSYVLGVEGEIVMRPTQELTLSAAATYLDAKVNGAFTRTADGTQVYNAQGYTGNFKDSDLPFTPKFSGNVDGQYEWSVAGNKTAFIGGTAVYQGSQNTTFKNSTLLAGDFAIASYTTVDLRAGLASADGKWRAMAYGRNVTNKRYTTSVTSYLDTLFRFSGRPAVYGLSLQMSF